jgi:predicted amidohydrolase
LQKLKVHYIQSDLHWQSVEANLASLEESIWRIEGESDLIILPEMFSTGFSMEAKALAEPMNSKTFRWMKQQAAQTHAMVMGSYIVQEKGNYFNRLFAVAPDGQYHTYDKRHLFALAGEDGPYTQGIEKLVFEWRGWRICPMICYDLRFPVWARSEKRATLYEYDLLVFVANWPSPRIHAWDVLLQARAIENIAYVIGVNRVGFDENGHEYTGHSAIIDYTGKLLCQHEDDAAIGSAELDPEMLNKFRNRFPFQADADRFQLL